MNMQQLMRQAQDMQRKLAKQQEELKVQEFEGQSGGGLIRAKVAGNSQLISVNIDPKVVDPTDVGMLQDLVVVAVNDALKKVSDASQGGMMGLMNQMGIKLPGF